MYIVVVAILIASARLFDEGVTAGSENPVGSKEERALPEAIYIWPKQLSILNSSGSN